MEQHRREFFVARILSGHLRIRHNDKVYLISNLSPLQAYRAAEIYEDALSSDIAKELMPEEEIIEYMKSIGLWSDLKQQQLDNTKKQMEDLKVRLYQCAYRSLEAKKVRHDIQDVRKLTTELLLAKHSLDHMTRESYAALLKQNYTVGASLRTENGTPVFMDESFVDSDIVLDIADSVKKLALHDSELRELSRTEPWRCVWGSNKTNVFGKPSCDWTDEQRVIVLWTKLYDSVFESPDSPHESVIEDDDMLDGWLIMQRREREARQMQKQGDDLISSNPKIKGAQNVFIMAETIEDARKVDALNSPEARAAKRQRAAMISAHGEVDFTKLPDVRWDMLQESKKG